MSLVIVEMLASTNKQKLYIFLDKFYLFMLMHETTGTYSLASKTLNSHAGIFIPAGELRVWLTRPRYI